MSPTATVLPGHIAWTLLLLLVMEVMRTALVLGGRRRADSFEPDGSDGSPFAQHLARAHANCLEGFPVFGGLVRFTFFAVQLGIAGVWCLRLSGAWPGA